MKRRTLFYRYIIKLPSFAIYPVSLGAILLSLYYILFWKNPHTRNLHLPLVSMGLKRILKQRRHSNSALWLSRRRKLHKCQLRPAPCPTAWPWSLFPWTRSRSELFELLQIMLYILQVEVIILPQRKKYFWNHLILFYKLWIIRRPEPQFLNILKSDLAESASTGFQFNCWYF
jgi:hypothetical protein